MSDDRHFRTDDVEAQLRRRSVRGTAITFLGRGGQFVVTIGFTAVLARLLTPADFGLVAMVTVVTVLVMQFKDLGLLESTVQQAEIDQAKISTLFWINVLVSAALTGVIAALAPLLAWFYDEPRLVLVTFAVAPVSLIGGLAIQHHALLRRQMRFGTLAAISLAAPTIGFGAAIGAALLGAGYWAQVVFVVAMPAAMTAGMWIGCRWRPGRPVRGAGIGSMLSFGAHLTGTKVLGTFICHVDKILVGKLVGVAALGVYTKAFYLFNIPAGHAGDSITAVAYSALSRLKDDPPRYRLFYTRGLELAAALILPVVVFGFVAAPRIIGTVLGDQWTSAIPIFRALAPMVLMSIFQLAANWAYVSLGHTRRQLRWAVVETIGVVAAFAVGVQWGVLGLALSYSGALTILRPLGLAYCFRGTFLGTRTVVSALWPPAAAATAAGIAMWLVDDRFLPTLVEGDPIALLASLLVFGVVYTAAWLALPRGRRAVREMLHLTEDFRAEPKPAPVEETEI